jgi:hypothetical protein
MIWSLEIRYMMKVVKAKPWEKTLFLILCFNFMKTVYVKISKSTDIITQRLTNQIKSFKIRCKTLIS